MLQQFVKMRMEKRMSADGNRQPVQSARENVFPKSGTGRWQYWEMIHKLAWAPGTVHLKGRLVESPPLSLHKLRRDWAFKMFQSVH